MNRKYKKLIFIIPSSIVIVAIISYMINFRNIGISIDSKDWGGFGSFINPFITLANVCLFIIVNILLYNLNSSNSRPILTFKTILEGKEIWQIINVGNGAALNLIVSYKLRSNEDWVEPTVKCYSLGKNELIDLDWLSGSVDVIAVSYVDIFDDQYITLIANDTVEVRKYSEFKEVTINKHTYTKNDIQKLLEKKSIRLALAKNATTTTQTTKTP